MMAVSLSFGEWQRQVDRELSQRGCPVSMADLPDDLPMGEYHAEGLTPSEAVEEYVLPWLSEEMGLDLE
jgi:hypothetical protein